MYQGMQRVNADRVREIRDDRVMTLCLQQSGPPGGTAVWGFLVVGVNTSRDRVRVRLHAPPLYTLERLVAARSPRGLVLPLVMKS